MNNGQARERRCRICNVPAREHVPPRACRVYLAPEPRGWRKLAEDAAWATMQAGAAATRAVYHVLWSTRK